MDDPKPKRTVALIDRDLEVERALLIYEERNGRRSNGACATWRHIDHLLDERLVLMLSVVPALSDAAPAAVDGGPLRRRRRKQ